jgi:hypothetical protein
MQSKAEQKALLKLLAQDFDLGVFLAEAKQTVKLVGDTSFSIAKQVKRWRAFNKPSQWELVKKWERGNLPCHLWHKIPQSWLQLQYGWIPLLNDIWGAAAYLSRYRLLQGIVHVKGYAEDFDDLIDNVSGRAAGDLCQPRFDVEHKVWVSLYYKLNSPVIAELSSLGLINPAAIVWEKTVYSFVVDWIVPVGGWLRSLTADAGFSFYSGSCSRLSKLRSQNANYSEAFAPDVPTRTTSGDMFSVRGEGYNFSRTCYSNSPVPGVYIKNPLSFLHAANGIALLVQAFR